MNKNDYRIKMIVDYSIDILQIEDRIVHQHKDSILTHIQNVKFAASKVGFIPHEQLSRHDESKWSMEEFSAYAVHFHGGGNPDGFSRAWHHHIRHNPHHWQHWMFPDDFELEGSQVVNGCLPMPVYYVREMVADWLGASMTYTGSWDIEEWLLENLPKICLHPLSAGELRLTLSGLGYRFVWDTQLASEESIPEHMETTLCPKNR